MTQNIYFEARGEPILGQLAVGLVTLNRMNDARFPKTICEVVRQGCQFSWYCDGKSDKLPYSDSVKIATWLSKLLLTGTVPDFTEGALFFHSVTIKTHFSEKTIEIGNHIFYRRG